MSERKNHLDIEGGQVKEDDHIASYKPIPETDSATEAQYLDDEDPEYVPEQSEITIGEEADDFNNWSPGDIKILLTTYLMNIEKFRNSKMKKKGLWAEISQAVGKPLVVCDRKFRNLKQTYIRLLKKKVREGVSLFKWPYFDIFEEIYLIDGEYHPEIKDRLQDKPEVTPKSYLAKAATKMECDLEFPETSHQTEDNKKKLNRKRYAEFKKVALEMRDRQRMVEAKLDRLISIVEDSNNIQVERNRLFQQYLQSLQRG